jgi:hypothetical protein
MTKSKRTFKALFAVTGTKEELKDFETVLKAKGAEGTMSNETGRMLYKWLVVYADFETESKKDCKLTFAYRSTNCKDTTKPKVLLLRTARERMSKDYYVRNGEYRASVLSRILK